MFRFIHSADWQLGTRLAQFGSRGPRLREARLATLQRTLDLAVQHQVDAFLVAGDLFEDNQVDDSLVSAVIGLFAAHPSLPIYLLPGNHDPASGPTSVWQRKAFLNAPAHIHVLREAGVTDLGGNTFLIASPLHQKASTVDPSLKLTELAATLPADSIKIGLTHGSPAIEGKHKANDFPIALNAASRAGLDYLGLGHWHNWLADCDSGRMVMPGTPEPDNFGNDNSGHVALVEITGPGQPPKVEPLRVAGLTWIETDFDFTAVEAARATLTGLLAELSPKADRTVLRVTLKGTASPSDLAAVQNWLEPVLKPFLVGQFKDRTRIALSAVEMADLQSRHPILGQVLADLDRIEALATGSVLNASADTPTSTLTLAEVQELTTPSRIELSRLTPDHFTQMRSHLFRLLQEVFV